MERPDRQLIGQVDSSHPDLGNFLARTPRLDSATTMSGSRPAHQKRRYIVVNGAPTECDISGGQAGEKNLRGFGADECGEEICKIFACWRSPA
jgi:hypothetical protein